MRLTRAGRVVLGLWPATSAAMSVVLKCPYCKKKVAATNEQSGKVISCTTCQKSFRVPIAPPEQTSPPLEPAQTSTPPDLFVNLESDESPRERKTGRYRELSGNPVGDFLVFRLMLTPLIIQIVFWIGVLGCLAIGGRMIVEALDTNGPFKRSVSHYELAIGVVVALVGPLIWRVYCELAIIFFKIHDELKKANDRTRYRS